jgi:phosphogluconate dehydratase
VYGDGLSAYTLTPARGEQGLQWQTPRESKRDNTILRPHNDAFQDSGGMQLLEGNLGRSIIKISAVAEEHRQVSAPAVIFDNQQALKEAYDAGALNRDLVAVVRGQGPSANGMPELHKLTPYLANLQDLGFSVALVTDGRMSGASGKVPAAIHLSPESSKDGPIAKLKDGDIIELNADRGELNVLLSAAELAAREPATGDLSAAQHGLGRELFGSMRDLCSGAEQGASFLLRG